MNWRRNPFFVTQWQRGQILPLGPILVMVLIAAIILQINVGLLTTRRMRMQTAADSAAHATAFTLACELSFLTTTNDAIMMCMGGIGVGIGLMGLSVVKKDIKLLFRGLRIIDRMIKIKGKIKKLQDKMLKAAPYIAMAAGEFQMVSSLGGDFRNIGFAVPTLPGDRELLKLNVKRNFMGLMMRESVDARHDWKEIGETALLIGIYLPVNAPKAFGGALLASRNSKYKPSELRMQFMIAVASAKPYWRLHNSDSNEPRSDEMASVRAIFCMLIPAPWAAKLIDTDEQLLRNVQPPDDDDDDKKDRSLDDLIDLAKEVGELVGTILKAILNPGK